MRVSPRRPSPATRGRRAAVGSVMLPLVSRAQRSASAARNAIWIEDGSVIVHSNNRSCVQITSTINQRPPTVEQTVYAGSTAVMPPIYGDWIFSNLRSPCLIEPARNDARSPSPHDPDLGSASGLWLPDNLSERSGRADPSQGHAGDLETDEERDVWMRARPRRCAHSDQYLSAHRRRRNESV
jgi:hypothetical protein